MRDKQKRIFSEIGSNGMLTPWKPPSFSFLPQVLPADSQYLGDLLLGMVSLKNEDRLFRVLFNRDKVFGAPGDVFLPQQAWWKLFRADGFPFVGEVQCVFDHIFHLSHIPGPRIGHERLKGSRGDSRHGSGMGVTEALEKMSCQGRDVFLSLAERRQEDRDHVQAEEKVLTEHPVTDRFFEVPVRRRDDSDIKFLNLRIPDPAALPFLEKAEQFHLNRQWDLPDFIEEESATVGRLDKAFVILYGPCKRSSHVTEEF